MKTLTVFTPTYNRKHTITRTYESLCRQSSHNLDWLVIDDGSSDGTREWIESLGQKVKTSGRRFDWMGRFLDGEDENHFVIESHFVDGEPLRIEYVYKPNGGLYTGYNVAYQTIQTELNVCVDSDDYMPEDAVEKIVMKWSSLNLLDRSKYCGIEGLDFDIRTMQPIGGFFPNQLHEIYMHEIALKKLHKGDTKLVMRTDLMKDVAPMIGFMGEKNFNPVFLLLKVCDSYPILVVNDNYCIVDYQIGSDSMSEAILKQYFNSPRSFSKMRQLEMSLKHNTWRDRFRSSIHYVSSCIIAKDGKFLRNSPCRILTLLSAPLGVLLFIYLLIKTRK